MCKADCDCKKNKPASGARMTAGSELRSEMLEGKTYAVFPVVMAIPDVVMNGSLFPAEEYFVDAWNGVPVTIGHPETDDGEFLSASEPHALEAYCVGRLFNVSIREDDNALIGEAWVDVEKLSSVDASLHSMLYDGDPIDVSTGFYSHPVPQRGESNGEEFEIVHTFVIPNHLALLPGEEGACNWESGCGVRNKEKPQVSTYREIVKRLEAAKNRKKAKKAPVKNADGDKAACIDAMIANEDVPFGEDDRTALESMSDNALKAMADKFMPADEPAEEEVAKKNAEGDEPSDDVSDEVANEEGDDKEKKDAATNKGKGTMNKEDREAIAFARKIVGNHRKELVTKIVANSTITEAQANAMDTATLEVVANGLHEAPANYGGAPLPAANDADKKVIEAMSGGSVVAHFKKKAK